VHRRGNTSRGKPRHPTVKVLLPIRLLALWFIMSLYNPFRLRPVDPFGHSTAQIGDTFYYTIQSEDQIEQIVPEGRCNMTQYLLPRILTTISTVWFFKLGPSLHAMMLIPSPHNRQWSLMVIELLNVSEMVNIYRHGLGSWGSCLTLAASNGSQEMPQ